MLVRRPLIVALALGACIFVGNATPAMASTGNCRAAARSLSTKWLSLQPVTQEGLNQAAAQALQADPNCEPEFQQLWAYFQANAKVSGSQAFPFPASGDPATPFLGPLGWWWNIIYVTMFGRSVMMMFLFGWELFFAPILFVFAAAWALLSTGWSAVTGGLAQEA